MADKLEITNAEWRIMRIVWTLGKATSNQVIDILQQKTDWKPATIKTLLRRLVEKGALQTTRHGRAFIYTACVQEQATMNQSADELFDSICEMHVGSTIAHVIKQRPLSKSDIQRLQKILAEKLPDAPDEVDCNCVPNMRCE
ncbi:penicillinase repressor [Limosilactobacillus frumenti DSM 13145]|uniref:Penicillinase repressor n=1 Tax=Limosilactobacillus frumenti DSM 13145 TaxID=1423746 RepID=A0A0R1P3F7_9LACO|nr:CopY/TcrY family copper transport repressor [Limosilactobacillus frumenti]KRL27143.1 penicillinase repressor [Limosilactobacillus frumenti DSM 13145]MBA2913832.1 CopY/TcrY family copper transport repressor [Limosilactobacillus frumenti]QFG72610.1 CopY/TcrY family copper transport repressor [Limosilactobacillus frumenti]